MLEQKMAYDPVRLEFVKNAIGSVVDKMVLTVVRIAYSSIMKDTMDMSSAFCDRRGRMIAQGLKPAIASGVDSRRDGRSAGRVWRLPGARRRCKFKLNVAATSGPIYILRMIDIGALAEGLIFYGRVAIVGNTGTLKDILNRMAVHGCGGKTPRRT